MDTTEFLARLQALGAYAVVNGTESHHIHVQLMRNGSNVRDGWFTGKSASHLIQQLESRAAVLEPGDVEYASWFTPEPDLLLAAE